MGAIGHRGAAPGVSCRRRAAAAVLAVLASCLAGCGGLTSPDASVAVTMAAPAAATEDHRRSGIDFASAETQAMQRDDTLNPGMLWVADGAALWSQPPAGRVDPGAPAAASADTPSCATCHGDAASSMRGVAARYPRFDERLQRPLSLRERIAACRVEHQPGAAPLAVAGQALLGLETFVAHQSRGLPLQPDADPRLAPWRARGERLYRQRIGQLDLSCAQCHDERAGGRLGGAVIPQAHPTGYPIYRLEWQGVGSLVRRLRGCMTGVRAEPFSPGAPEWVELELYLNARAAGMTVETPGVRP